MLSFWSAASALLCLCVKTKTEKTKTSAPSSLVNCMRKRTKVACVPACLSLQSVRNHAAQLAEGVANAVRSSGDDAALASDADDYGDGTHLAVGPLHTRPFSSSNAAADMGATAPGVGWGGKSQSQLFHTLSEHDPPNDITLPPQVRCSAIQYSAGTIGAVSCV